MGLDVMSPYQPGEVVYIQEPYIRAEEPDEDENYIVWYAADYPNDPTFGPAQSSVTMPKWASRSHARIVDVRPEQIRAITEDEAVREGIEFYLASGGTQHENMDMVSQFSMLWESLYPGSWSRNDYVWRYGLERVDE